MHWLTATQYSFWQRQHGMQETIDVGRIFISKMVRLITVRRALDNRLIDTGCQEWQFGQRGEAQPQGITFFETRANESCLYGEKLLR